MFESTKFDLIQKEFDNNKNSHSYIFYTNDFFGCQKDVYSLIKYIFKNDNLENISTDLFIIKKNDKKSILKEEMTNLINFFKTTSYINKKRMYLIEEVHKLNSTTANMMLKFLEEPTDGIIAFFITDSLDSVLNTIKSRCQIVNVFYNNKTQNSESIKDKEVYNILFKSDKYKSLLNIKKQFEKYNRDEIIVIFKDLLNLIINNNNVNELYNIKVLNNAISMLNNNVSIDYVFDYVLLKRSD